MDADGYWARKALLVRELWVAVKVPTFYSGNWRFRDTLLGQNSRGRRRQRRQKAIRLITQDKSAREYVK